MTVISYFSESVREDTMSWKYISEYVTIQQVNRLGVLRDLPFIRRYVGDIIHSGLSSDTACISLIINKCCETTVGLLLRSSTHPYATLVVRSGIQDGPWNKVTSEGREATAKPSSRAVGESSSHGDTKQKKCSFHCNTQNRSSHIRLSNCSYHCNSTLTLSAVAAKNSSG
ncbi:uncharacterized protein LOC143921164 [Arctopsyche grandis]|uniref:uncharacterized protein LOC143921164 n=1 Tax=Arctopsyche grandis TaxID=121162 RepID=UPI00406D91CF